MDTLFFSMQDKGADDIENIYIKFTNTLDSDFLTTYSTIPAIFDVTTKFLDEYNLSLLINVSNRDNNFNGCVTLFIFDTITDVSHPVIFENLYSKRTIEVRTPFKLIQVSNSAFEIPKIIHQSYKDYLRITNLKACQSWKYFNPAFAYKYWTDDDCRTLIKQNFSNDVLKVYDNLYAGAFKADIFRLCVLYLEGGVWADISTLCASPISLLLSDKVNLVTAFDGPAQNDDFIGVIWQAFIISPKGSPVIKYILDFTINKLLNESEYQKLYPWFKNKNCIHGPLTVSGPFVFAAALNLYIGREASDIFEENTYDGGITIISHDSKSLMYCGKKILNIKYPNFSKDRYNIHYSTYYNHGCIIKKQASNHIADYTAINIYQIWIQSNIISENLLSNTQSWIRHYKEYNYILLTNDEILTMIKDEDFPSFYQCYLKLKPYAYRSELFRFYLLYKNGGIYSDIQTRCINKYGGFDNHTDLCVFVDVITNVLTISFIYAKKGNKFLKSLLTKICKNISESSYPVLETDLCGQTLFQNSFLSYYGFKNLPEEGVYLKMGETIKVAFYNKNLPMPKGSWIDSARNYSVKKGNVLEAQLLNTESKWINNSVKFSLGDILINDNGRLKGATNTPLHKNIAIYKEGLMIASYNEFKREAEFLDGNNHHELFKNKQIYL
jgi:mannosyltransferase OCH1-like enzyme